MQEHFAVAVWILSSWSVCVGTLISIRVCNSVSLTILRILYTSIKLQTHTLTYVGTLHDDMKKTAIVGNFFETITYGGHVYGHTMHMLLYIHLCRYGWLSAIFGENWHIYHSIWGVSMILQCMYMYTCIYTHVDETCKIFSRSASEWAITPSLTADRPHWYWAENM